MANITICIIDNQKRMVKRIIICAQIYFQEKKEKKI